MKNSNLFSETIFNEDPRDLYYFSLNKILQRVSDFSSSQVFSVVKAFEKY